MQKTTIRLGYCPTRRDVFSREEAMRYGRLVKETLAGHPVELVDLAGINEEELLFRDADVPAVVEKFRAADVDALFFPHCNFGSENCVAQVAREFRLPVLLWGPRDDAPDAEGLRSRDSQCGLFATGKVLRRHNVPFTYLTNSWADSREFHTGIDKFLRVASVVKAVTRLKILQISTRPAPFCSVICNENELIERFGIQCCPVTLDDLVTEMERVMAAREPAFRETCGSIRSITAAGSEEDIHRAAGLKLAMRSLAEARGCRAVAIQCWDSLQHLTGVMPCLSNALLSDEGLPVVCETDIHGAITAVMTQALTFNTEPQFFADLTVRHPEDDNAELLWHCGNFPRSLAGDQASAVAGLNRYNADRYGVAQWELKSGELTIARFDGDHGDYRLLIGEAVTTEGPRNLGSYVWMKVENWPLWEHRLVEGPYIHHVSGVYGHYGDILLEACRYIPGLTADVVEPGADELRRRWMA